MGTIRVATQAWPLVVSVARGEASLDEHVRYLAAWRGWFAREQRFVVLRLFEDEASLIHPDGAAQATKAWLRDGAAEGIRQWVAAMVNVVPPAAHPGFAHMSMERTFGVPGMIAANLSDAIGWLEESAVLDIDWRGAVVRSTLVPG